MIMLLQMTWFQLSSSPYCPIFFLLLQVLTFESQTCGGSNGLTDYLLLCMWKNEGVITCCVYDNGCPFVQLHVHLLLNKFTC